MGKNIAKTFYEIPEFWGLLGLVDGHERGKLDIKGELPIVYVKTLQEKGCIITERVETHEKMTCLHEWKDRCFCNPTQYTETWTKVRWER